MRSRFCRSLLQMFSCCLLIITKVRRIGPSQDISIHSDRDETKFLFQNIFSFVAFDLLFHLCSRLLWFFHQQLTRTPWSALSDRTKLQKSFFKTFYRKLVLLFRRAKVCRNLSSPMELFMAVIRLSSGIVHLTLQKKEKSSVRAAPTNGHVNDGIWYKRFRRSTFSLTNGTERQLILIESIIDEIRSGLSAFSFHSSFCQQVEFRWWWWNRIAVYTPLLIDSRWQTRWNSIRFSSLFSPAIFIPLSATWGLTLDCY